MDTNVIFKRVLGNDLPSNIEDGSIIIYKQKQSLYVDFPNNERIQITDLIFVNSKNDIGTDPYIDSTKLYITQDDRSIYRYLNNEVICLSGVKSIYYDLTDKSFIYDNTKNNLDATISMDPNETYTLGSIIIDSYNSFGIIKEIDTLSDTLRVRILYNNVLNNVLQGYDYYINSYYDGSQIGSIEKPFKTLKTLLESNNTLINENIENTIHIMSNNTIDFDSDEIVLQSLEEGWNNVKIISDSKLKNYDLTITTRLDADNNIYGLKKLNNVLFENLNIFINTPYDFYTLDCNNLIFKNCKFRSICEFWHISNSNNKGDITFIDCEFENDLKIDLINVDLNVYNTKNFEFANDTNYKNISIKMYNSFDINFENTINCDELLLVNSSIKLNRNNILIVANKIQLQSGYVKEYSTSETIETTISLQSNNDIDIGVFDFKNVTLIIKNGNGDIDNTKLKIKAGLNSSQVHDFNIRKKYTPNNATLKSHLDAIDEAMINIYSIPNTQVNNLEDDNIVLGNSLSFITKDW